MNYINTEEYKRLNIQGKINSYMNRVEIHKIIEELENQYEEKYIYYYEDRYWSNSLNMININRREVEDKVARYFIRKTI